MAQHVILGKGPVGTTTARLLAGRGEDVRVISRSGGSSSAGVEHVALDGADATALTTASGGAGVIYNCANPAYSRWSTDWPPVAAALLQAAEASGAVLVTMGNLYGYGPVDAPMTEDTSLAAHGTRGGCGPACGRTRWPVIMPGGSGSRRPAPPTSTAPAWPRTPTSAA